MNLIVMDTETTGFLHERDINGAANEVIQFSAIEISPGFKIERVINRYCKSTAFISEGAYKVHRLTDKKVDTLSGGKFFEQVVIEEGLRELRDVMWVIYNAPFDKGIVNQTLVQNGAAPINFGKQSNHLSFDMIGNYYFDLMPSMRGIAGSKHNIKLTQAVNKYIGAETFRALCANFRKEYGIVNPLTGEDHDEDYFHNSAFDAYALCLLLHIHKNRLFD